MKTHTDYEVKLQIKFQKREILQAQCQCPAGVGPEATCKHVSAILFGIEFYIVTGNLTGVGNYKRKVIIKISFREREAKFDVHWPTSTVAQAQESW